MKPPVNCHIKFEPLKMNNCRKKCVIPKELIQNVCKTLWIKAKSQHFNHIFWLCLIYNTLWWWCTKTTVQKLYKGHCVPLKTPCVMSGRYERMDTAQAWCLVLTFFTFLKQALMKQREKANVKNVFTSRFKRQKKFPTLVSVRSNVVCSPWSKAACIGSVCLCVKVTVKEKKEKITHKNAQKSRLHFCGVSWVTWTNTCLVQKSVIVPQALTWACALHGLRHISIFPLL